MATERRTIGRAAGLLILLGSVVSLLAGRVLTSRHLPGAFDFAIGVALVSGAACLLTPWDRLDARWLNVIPILVTIELAVGIYLSNLHGDIASSYYILVAAFAGWAFTSRWVIVGHVTLAAGASVLTLFHHRLPGSETPARAAVTVMLIVAIGVIVTLLREGLQHRQAELEDLALRDPLTGVGNYRLLADRLDYELARHRRSEEPLSVLLLDMDGFKQINDTYGHLAGDQILIDVAAAIRSAVRSQDTVARQGGDEFSILAPETDDEQAQILVERVHEAIAEAVGRVVTTSIGSATFPEDGSDAGALRNLADADLRRIKQQRAPRRSRRSTSVHGR